MILNVLFIECCLYREYFMYPIDETTMANNTLLSEYKMLQVRKLFQENECK